MLNVSAADLARVLDYGSLVDALEEGFRGGATVPLRHHHTIDRGGAGHDAVLLLMPAWTDAYVGIKTVAVFPENGDRGLPAVMASYQLLSGVTGETLALLDGGELTARRTASASALAARHLARADASHLLVVGTGRLSLHLMGAHASQRPITRVTFWGRNPEKAQAQAEAARELGFDAAPAADLRAAVAGADIISCATLSREPLVPGAWLVPGQHLDLAGAFTPEMRESDDDAVRRARVFVDTRDGACAEGGDIVQPLAAGVITEKDIEGDLFDIIAGRCGGHRGADDITLFKSTGTALEDLAAAKLAFERLGTS